MLPAVWLIAAISYECVEKPFLRLKKRFKSDVAMGEDGVSAVAL
jgi:peptidoglycan/LPS O-acetylase OafA/YrhL